MKIVAVGIGQCGCNIVDEFYAFRMASLKEFLANIERSLILDTLEKTKGDQKKAAEILGLKYTTLHEKIKRYHIYFRTVVF